MADYLTDEEQVDRLKRWWQENGTSIVVAAVLSIGGIAGWRWYDAAQIEKMQAASETYETYLVATDDVRAEFAARLDAEFAGTSYAVLAQLRHAKDLAEADDMAGAMAIFRQIIATDAHPLLADIARVRLARLLREQGDADAALGMLAEVASQGFRAQVLELKGDIHLAADERALAHEAYVSAAAEIAEGQERPILDIKVEDTAPPPQPAAPAL